MYGSYGSYSSMGAASAPIDIASRNLRANDDSCAFPSWPRRSSLSESDHEPRATSFLSDDDLFLSDPFEDDVQSISSSGSSTPSAIDSPNQVAELDFFDAERDRVALQREFVRQTLLEKERRKQQAARKYRRSTSGSSKKSPTKTRLTSMTPIAEACE